MGWLKTIATCVRPLAKDDRTRIWHTMDTAPKKGRVLLWNHEAGVWASEYLNGEWPLFQWNGKVGLWHPKPYCWRHVPEGPRLDEWSLPVVAEAKG